MGWSTGSELCNDIWEDIERYIPEDKRKEASARLCAHFVFMDADDFPFEEGTPYYNYLELYEPETFKEYLEDIENQ